jgi:hypothetical protein
VGIENNVQNIYTVSLCNLSSNLAVKINPKSILAPSWGSSFSTFFELYIYFSLVLSLTSTTGPFQSQLVILFLSPIGSLVGAEQKLAAGNQPALSFVVSGPVGTHDHIFIHF